MSEPLKALDTLTVLKGNQHIGLSKGQKLTVVKITDLGKDYSYFVRITLQASNGTRTSLYLRYASRLSDTEMNLGCGDGINSIRVTR